MEKEESFEFSSNSPFQVLRHPTEAVSAPVPATGRKATRSLAGIAGWIVALGCAVALGLMGARLLDAKREAARMKEDLAAQRTMFDGQHAETEKQLEGANKTIERLERRLAELEGESANEGGEEPAVAQPSFDKLARLFTKSAPKGAGEGEGAAGGKENFMSAMAGMFQGESGQKMADFSAGMAVDMAYKDLFANWNLPEDVEEQARQIIKDHMSEQIKASMEVFGSGFDKEKIDKLEEDGKNQLRQQLSGVLNAQELAQWEEYESTIEDHMLKQQFDMQLGMFAPGLTPENRAIVRDVLAEESLAGKDSAEGIDDIQASFETQSEALDRAYERLSQDGRLDEAQLAEFDRFMSSMEQQMEMARTMFNSFTQEPSAPAASTPK